MVEVPSSINFQKKSQNLVLVFDDREYSLPAELLRVLSPSAEVRGHGGEGGTLPTGKRDVQIRKIETAGNYALKITFSDGHDSGLFDWQYLKFLGQKQSELWQEYLDKLEKAGAHREALFIQAKQV